MTSRCCPACEGVGFGDRCGTAGTTGSRNEGPAFVVTFERRVFVVSSVEDVSGASYLCWLRVVYTV